MGHCFNSTVVNAPIGRVWKTVRNFHDMSWCDSVITSCTAVGKIAGDEVGAKRVLNGAFQETLMSIDDDDHCFSYSIDDGPEPVSKESVSEYIGTVTLRPVTDTNATFVQWESDYEIKESEDLVAGFCNPIYAALLEALKAKFA